VVKEFFVREGRDWNGSMPIPRANFKYVTVKWTPAHQALRFRPFLSKGSLCIDCIFDGAELYIMNRTIR
jgi:hypothetical protein